METLLKYKKAKFIGHRDNLKKELKDIEGFPFRTYIDNDGFPVIFANDDELKKDVFRDCEELGIEIIE